MVNSIASFCQRLRDLTEVDRHSDWQVWQSVQNPWMDLTLNQVFSPECAIPWSPVVLNDRQHIFWPRGRQVLWLKQGIVLPDTLTGYPLQSLTARLALTWWAEKAEIFIDGVLVQAGDLFDHSARILLCDGVTSGAPVEIAIRLVSPEHDDGALVCSLLQFESQNEAYPEPGFVAQEIEVLQRYLQEFAPQELIELEAILATLDWHVVADRPVFDQQVSDLRDRLCRWSSWLKQRCICLLGHAHLDLAWLWPVTETWAVAEHTFESVLNLQHDFPDLVFGHSTPALYAGLEHQCPDLFQQVLAKLSQGVWEAIGGLWVEPDLVLSGGEAIVRHLLYGQRYTRQHLGQMNRVAWLPDSFGFCWQLPQLLRQAEIDYFVTQKLTWNDTTQFPYPLFWWQAPDGSQILSLMSAPIGTSIEPTQMADYAITWEAKTGLQQSLWLPGVGDHGGGPTRDMLEIVRRWQRSPLFPKLGFTPAHRYLDSLHLDSLHLDSLHLDSLHLDSLHLDSLYLDSLHLNTVKDWRTGNAGRSSDQPQVQPLQSHAQVTDRPTLQSPLATSGTPGKPYEIPTHGADLYLELHRGCYTTHAEQKKLNRRSEALLYEAELLASLATLIAQVSYPKLELETAWKQILFNQFHDILPGSSSPQVFAEANETWQAVLQSGQTILDQSLQTIATHIQHPKPPHPQALPIVVFNTLNWERSELVSIARPPHSLESSPDLQRTMPWIIQDLEGRSHPTQLSWDGEQLLFWADAIPGVGYRSFWLCPAVDSADSANYPGDCRSPATADPAAWILENDDLRVTIDPEIGNVKSVFDRQQQREILSAPGNQLQFFQERRQYWDAWNIDAEYAENPLPDATLSTIEWLETGPLRVRLRVTRQFNASHIQQDYVLDINSPYLKIETSVDWQETHVLLKAAFPLVLDADVAACEMACGTIERVTRPTTPAEAAQWEVPAHRWVDLSVDRKEPDATSTVNDKDVVSPQPGKHPSEPSCCEQNGSVWGVSLLNDCKYGYDVKPNQIRLTLLRSPVWPDPLADRGSHRFTYALYPHGGTWQQAKTVHHGYELNQPFHVLVCSAKAALSLQEEDLPASATLLNMGSDPLILMAFKRAEEDDRWILRCYESEGQPGILQLHSVLNLQVREEVNLLELSEQKRSKDPVPPGVPTLSEAIPIESWQIKSVQIDVVSTWA